MVRLPLPFDVQAFGLQASRPVAGAILLATLLAPGAAFARPTAVVKEILDGKEMFIEAKPASVNQKAQAPEVVSTKASRGTLAFDNGALARINRNSQFKLQANCFLLTKGQVLVSGRQNVCTPSVKLSARGTNFVVSVEDDGTTNLSVLEGSVAVQAHNADAKTWVDPVQREVVRISPEGTVVDRRCLVASDYERYLNGGLFEGFKQPMPALSKLASFLQINVPVPATVLSTLTFGLL
ncbi:MAG: FecR family protein [Synechococcus sp.]|nr:FecR family protein [Synechococcus sp.]